MELKIEPENISKLSLIELAELRIKDEKLRDNLNDIMDKLDKIAIVLYGYDIDTLCDLVDLAYDRLQQLEIEIASRMEDKEIFDRELSSFETSSNSEQ